MEGDGETGQQGLEGLGAGQLKRRPPSLMLTLDALLRLR
jgi:hypothetical protein